MPDAYVRMNGQVVSSIRYSVGIGGVYYEGFCADPNLPGSESSGAVYVMSGTNGVAFQTVLRYGFPVNPYLTEAPGLTDNDRLWHVYLTRVAVAYLSRPNATWNGIDGNTRTALDHMLNPPANRRNFDEAHPAISVNGDRNHVAEPGLIPQSPTFQMGHSRRTNCSRNPFRFEWDSSTPAGTRLYVNGQYRATAPANINQVFYTSEGNHSGAAHGWVEAHNLHFIMPDGSEGQIARANMVGINNQYSGRVFVMQNHNSPDQWQDVGATR